MGGLLRAPKPVIVQPPAPAPAPGPASDPAVVAPVAATPEQAASEQRIAAQNLAPRGLAGLIATSPLGVLTPVQVRPRNTLLGE
jgi:hypothetical protein